MLRGGSRVRLLVDMDGVPAGSTGWVAGRVHGSEPQLIVHFDDGPVLWGVEERKLAVAEDPSAAAE